MTGMQLVRARRGAMAQIARAIGNTRAAVTRWEKVPAELVPKVEAITGIPRHELRPDLWEPPAAKDPATADAPP